MWVPWLRLSSGSKGPVGFESLIFGAEQRYGVARMVLCEGDI